MSKDLATSVRARLLLNLATAIAATFKRRGVAIPIELPIGLTDEFASDVSRQKLWQAFLRKNELAVTPLADVVKMLRGKLEPALRQAVLAK